MFCRKCGAEIHDEAVFCPNCGCSTSETSTKTKKEESSVLRTIAKIFMVLGCVSSGWCLFPLIWTIPMTIRYFSGAKVSTGFKVCSLLFVNMVAGIIMLCDSEQ